MNSKLPRLSRTASLNSNGGVSRGLDEASSVFSVPEAALASSGLEPEVAPFEEPAGVNPGWKKRGLQKKEKRC
jgi:hypothetical protein